MTEDINYFEGLHVQDLRFMILDIVTEALPIIRQWDNINRDILLMRRIILVDGHPIDENLESMNVMLYSPNFRVIITLLQIEDLL